MVSNVPDQPSFLKRAKLIENQPSIETKSFENSPSFLKRSKLISKPNEKYISDEQVQKDIERNQAQFTSRAIEGVAGLPGDLINFVGGIFGYEPNIPGSKELREFSENISGGYTKPKNELEEKAGETIQDIALFSFPGAKHYNVARNIGIPIAANLVKEGIKYYGADEKKQAYGKLGSMVILDILSHRKGLGTAQEYSSSLFKKADEQIPKGLSINASNLEKSLDTLEHSLTRGGSRPDTGDALQKIKEIKGEIKNGKIDLKSLVSYRPSINSWIDKYKGFDISVPPSVKKSIIRNLNQVKGEVIKSAEEYGSKYNPEYLKLSQSANEAYSAYAQSNKITNFIEKHASSKLKSNTAKLLLGLSGIGSVGGASLGGVAAGGSLALTGGLGYKAFKTLLRSKSPTLRNHYFKIIEGAAKGNASQVIKNSKLFDKEIEKEGLEDQL